MNQENRIDISNYYHPNNEAIDGHRTFTRVNGFIVPLESDGNYVECHDASGLRTVKGVVVGLCIMGLVYGLVVIFFSL